MEEISNAYDMPKAYREDLNIDYSMIQKAGIESCSNEYIWILRPSGTCLIPLYRGANPVHVSHWNNEDNLFFHIAGSSVNKINYEFALNLANEYPFPLSTVSSMRELMDKMDKLLSDSVVQSSAFEVVHLNSRVSSWCEWREWFKRTDNSMMTEFMDKAINQNKRLNQLRLVA